VATSVPRMVRLTEVEIADTAAYRTSWATWRPNRAAIRSFTY